MGLTRQASGVGVWKEDFFRDEQDESSLVIALAGNPNTGKSTVFNALTGLNQHTGNWPGKTVAQAKGRYIHRGKTATLIDLPGTYSLFANSVEEQVARDFICFGDPDVVVVVVDATCLERNLNLVLQVAEITDKVIVCLNLIDEAERKRIFVDHLQLSKELGIPVVPTVARIGKGLERLKDLVDDVATGLLKPNPIRVQYSDQVEEIVKELTEQLREVLIGKLNPRWVALRLIDGDQTIKSGIEQYLKSEEVDALLTVTRGVIG